MSHFELCARDARPPAHIDNAYANDSATRQRRVARCVRAMPVQITTVNTCMYNG